MRPNPRPQRRKRDERELIEVAIADANTFVREGLKRILGTESDLLVVGEAQDDLETVELVERSKPDILLLDLEIPKRKAVPILLDLTQKHAATKVLILSHFHDRESLLDTAKAGARGYALKNTLPPALVQAIRRIHAGEVWVDTQISCADKFLEFARQTDAHDAAGPENEVIKVLSRRELEILTLVATGSTNYEMSKRLFISVRTVKAHLNHVFRKLGVKNRTQAALRFNVSELRARR